MQTLASFALLLVVGHFVLMQIFRLTTYHRYFIWSSPLLAGWGAIVGFLMVKMRFDGLIWYWLLAQWIWLSWLGARNRRLGEAMVDLEDDPEMKRILSWSATQTRTYYGFSVGVALASAFIAYAILYNRSQGF